MLSQQYGYASPSGAEAQKSISVLFHNFFNLFQSLCRMPANSPRLPSMISVEAEMNS